jgi:hypothetical protein
MTMAESKAIIHYYFLHRTATTTVLQLKKHIITMILPTTKTAGFSLALFGISAFKTAVTAAAETCTSIGSITCVQTESPPTIDASISDWAGVEVFETPLTGALTSKMYTPGNVKIQCVYDADNIYFLYQIPGKYMFDATDNHKCAALGTMFQKGEEAEMYNMGNCPLSDAVNCEAVPEGCAPWAVDILHWELKTTERATTYLPNEGSGDDPIANKDDEFAVGPWCRVDDNFGTSPGNEWTGAHDFMTDATDAPVEDGTEGHYVFEISRPLTTPGIETDVQLKPGTELGYAVAFWDPYETDEGWTDLGHVVTGCSKDWIALRLVDENGNATPVFEDEETDTAASDVVSAADDTKPAGNEGDASQAQSTSASTVAGAAFTIFFAAAVANCVLF